MWQRVLLTLCATTAIVLSVLLDAQAAADGGNLYGNYGEYRTACPYLGGSALCGTPCIASVPAYPSRVWHSGTSTRC